MGGMVLFGSSVMGRLDALVGKARWSVLASAGALAVAVTVTSMPAAHAAPQPIDAFTMDLDILATAAPVIAKARANPYALNVTTIPLNPYQFVGVKWGEYSDPSGRWSKTTIKYRGPADTVGITETMLVGTPNRRGKVPCVIRSADDAPWTACSVRAMEPGNTRAIGQIGYLAGMNREALATGAVTEATKDVNGTTTTYRLVVVKDVRGLNYGYDESIYEYTWTVTPDTFSYHMTTYERGGRIDIVAMNGGNKGGTLWALTPTAPQTITVPKP